jgi:2-C-methyl-D-erythritol 4-phosphate cytidylyltransferase
MNADIPKQFLEINGLPILMHTLNVFNAYDPEMKLILVLPAAQFEFWKALCKKHDFKLPHQIVEGGTTRFHSVKNGIDSVTDTQALIAVHDGVRPLVSHDTIQRCFDAAFLQKAAIPVVELVDSIRNKK